MHERSEQNKQQRSFLEIAKHKIAIAGTGYSVLDVVKAFEKASGQKVQYKIVDRRAGDIAKCYADPSFAKEVLGWEAKRTLKQMCEDSWRWQSKNPNGYDGVKND